MSLLLTIIIVYIALIHLYILWFEMFAWETKGRKVFKSFPEYLFKDTKSMAANQGLYNGFLAAGLLWSLVIEDPTWSVNVAAFFMACVAIAGIYGTITAERKIFFVQALPALIGLSFILFGLA